MRRIQRDIRHEDFIKSLTSGESPIFSEIWRVLLFAAAYGVMKKQRTPLEKTESNKAMPASYFNTPGWKGFLYLIGFAKGESSDHLKNDEEQQNFLVTAFEEYANYGLIEISQRIISPSGALDSLLGMLLEEPRFGALEPDLNDLI
jgi:dnd system-associated protein 4